MKEFNIEKNVKNSLVRVLFSAGLFADATMVCLGIFILWLCSSFGYSVDRIIDAITSMGASNVAYVALLIYVPSFLLMFAIRIMFPKFKFTQYLNDINPQNVEIRNANEKIDELKLELEYFKTLDLAIYIICDILESDENRNKLSADEITNLIEQLRVFSKYSHNDYSQEFTELSISEQIQNIENFKISIQHLHRKVFDGLTFDERNRILNLSKNSQSSDKKLHETTLRKHTFLIGGIGTGKTVRIKELIKEKNLDNETTLIIDNEENLNDWKKFCTKTKICSFSEEVNLENFNTVIIDEAANLNNYINLKEAVNLGVKADTAVFILSFQNENDVFNFLKKNVI